MKKEPPMVMKPSATIDDLCQTGQVIKMIGSREESKGELDRVRRVVQLVRGLIISRNRVDKLQII